MSHLSTRNMLKPISKKSVAILLKTYFAIFGIISTVNIFLIHTGMIKEFVLTVFIHRLVLDLAVGLCASHQVTRILMILRGQLCIFFLWKM